MGRVDALEGLDEIAKRPGQAGYRCPCKKRDIPYLGTFDGPFSGNRSVSCEVSGVCSGQRATSNTRSATNCRGLVAVPGRGVANPTEQLGQVAILAMLGVLHLPR